MRSPLMPLCRPLALCSIRFSHSNVSTAITTTTGGPRLVTATGSARLDFHPLVSTGDPARRT